MTSLLTRATMAASGAGCACARAVAGSSAASNASSTTVKSEAKREAKREVNPEVSPRLQPPHDPIFHVCAASFSCTTIVAGVSHFRRVDDVNRSSVRRRKGLLQSKRAPH